MIALDWLKKLFVRNAPVETAKEEKTTYEIHCHKCDNRFMSGGILLDGLLFLATHADEIMPEIWWKKDAPDRIRQGFLPKALGYGGDSIVHFASQHKLGL